MTLSQLPTEQAQEIGQRWDALFPRTAEYQRRAPNVSRIQDAVEFSLVMDCARVDAPRFGPIVGAALDALPAPPRTFTVEEGVGRYVSWLVPNDQASFIAAVDQKEFAFRNEAGRPVMGYWEYFLYGEDPAVHFLWSSWAMECSVAGGPSAWIMALSEGSPSEAIEGVEELFEMFGFNPLPSFFCLNDWVRRPESGISNLNASGNP